MGLAESSWWLLGYALFAATSLLLVSVGQPTPDMLVAASFYVASALLVKIRARQASRRTFIALGLVLGFAYLAKAVMFPLGFVFLLTGVFAAGFSQQSLRRIGIALLFLMVASPFITAISHQKKHLTFGETGSWNYAFYVNHVGYFVTDLPGLKHPLRLLSVSPPIYEFGEPVSGTFPPWYDPTYWHEGVKPHPTIVGEFNPIANAGAEYAHEFFVLFLNATVGFFILFFTADNMQCSAIRSGQSWAVALPAIVTLILYALVHVETRFMSAVFDRIPGITFPAHRSRARAVAFTVRLVAATLFVMVTFGALVERGKMFGPAYPAAAVALEQNGIGGGAKLGLIWNENWNGNAAIGTYIPRLLRAKIVVEETNADDFWKQDEKTRDAAIEKMRAAGAGDSHLRYSDRTPGRVDGLGTHRLLRVFYFLTEYKDLRPYRHASVD